MNANQSLKKLTKKEKREVEDLRKTIFFAPGEWEKLTEDEKNRILNLNFSEELKRLSGGKRK